MALIKEYFELTKKYLNEYGENTILLMQVGSFYECYGIKKISEPDCEDIIYGSKIIDFSQICELNVVSKNTCVGEENVVMAGFKVEFLEKYLRKIQEVGFTTVVYKQDEAVKNTTRSLEGIYSPGTYFSNETTNLTNNLTCIWIEMVNNKFTKGKVVIVGISNIDIFTGKTNIFEYKENYILNPTTFDELERFISIYNPSEVIVISNLLDSEIKEVINFVNIRSNSIQIITTSNVSTSNVQLHKPEMLMRVNNCEKQTYQKELLNKFYKIHDFDVFFQNFYNNTIATQSFCFLLDYVYQHNQFLVYKISEPIFDNFSDRLILANHSLKQLNIIDDNNYNGKYSSVLKMLNSCLTPMGKREFTHKFLNPTTNVLYLEREYNIIEHMLLYYNKYDTFLNQQLKDIKDISKWERQVFIKKIAPKTFYNLHKNIKTIINVFNFIQSDETILTYLSSFNISFESINKIGMEINNYMEKNISLDIAKDIDQFEQFNVNFFNYGIDEKIDVQREIMTNSENKLEAIRVCLNNLIKSKEKTNKLTEYVTIHETEKNNYSLLTTNRRCKLLDESFPNDIKTIELSYKCSLNNEEKHFDFTIKKKCFEYIKQSASKMFIVDEQINNLCKKITSTKNMMKDLISLAYNKFVEDFGEKFQKHLEIIIHFITLVDIIYTKAYISKKYNYCKPNIVKDDNKYTKSFVDAKDLRHCLIEYLQTNEFYITNDMKIGTYDEDGNLIYGTNAVGKTSLIRALGISIIMAQSGLYVPCSEFNFIPYKYIFTRILGNDNIFKGLSTFAVEMSELRTILRLADENSLILGDELCSGTEIASAISIFVSGIQKLSSIGCSYIFATHLHEIVNYEEITSISNLKIKHMEVIYDKQNDCLVYDRKLKMGPGNNMYGLEVCKSLSLPEDFIENAYNIRMKYNKEKGSILSLKQSHFNAKKIMGMCEMCGINMGAEVHHLQHQSNAGEDGYINMNGVKIHKNNPANLLTLCEKCHDNFHKNDSTIKKNKQHKKIKTTLGIKIYEM
jgi:DNA mismatch repair protein MutS